MCVEFVYIASPIFKSLTSSVPIFHLNFLSYDGILRMVVSHDNLEWKSFFQAEDKRLKLAELKTGFDTAESLVWICSSCYNSQ